MIVPLVLCTLFVCGGLPWLRARSIQRALRMCLVLALMLALVPVLAAGPIQALAAPYSPYRAGADAGDASPAPSGASAAAEDGSRTAYVLVHAQSWLNVRERPEADAPVTLRLTRGDQLTVCRIDAAGWAEVSRAGDPGYCRARYLCDAPPDAPVACVATTGKLNVRAAPGGRTVGRLRRGEAVAVLGTLTDDGGTCWAILPDGFVLARYLEAVP